MECRLLLMCQGGACTLVRIGIYIHCVLYWVMLAFLFLHHRVVIFLFFCLSLSRSRSRCRSPADWCPLRLTSCGCATQVSIVSIYCYLIGVCWNCQLKHSVFAGVSAVSSVTFTPAQPRPVVYERGGEPTSVTVSPTGTPRPLDQFHLKSKYRTE